MARIKRVIDDGVSFYEHQIERDQGVTLFRGAARFVDEHRLETAGERVEFRHALIAPVLARASQISQGSTGSRSRLATTCSRRASYPSISSASERAPSRSNSPRCTAALAPR